MRIAVIAPRLPLRGGISAHTAALESALVARGHELVRVGFSRLYPPGLFPGKSETVPVSISGIPATEVILIDALNPFSWLSARRALRGERCDRVVFQWWHPFFSRLIATLVRHVDVPVIAVCHNARPHEGYPGWKRATRRALGEADLLVCHSQPVADELGALLPNSHRRIVAMPVLLPAIAKMNRAEARRRLGLRTGARLALFAGHARRYKGIEILLDAWDRAVLPNLAALAIVGESYLGQGRLQDAVARRRRSSCVRVVDRYQDDEELAAWIVAADVLVLPYLHASQSGLLSTAVAAGVAVIASDTGGLGDQARRAGGVLVEAGEVDPLSRALSVALARAPGADASRQSSESVATAVANAVEPLAVACESAIHGE